MRSTALANIAVGVVVERRRAKSVWVDFLWRPVSVFAGTPSAAPWTPLSAEAETTLFFAGEALTDAGSSLVEAVPMPPDVAEIVARFIAEHHVERPFVKRRREPAEPALARHGNGQENRK